MFSITQATQPLGGEAGLRAEPPGGNASKNFGSSEHRRRFVRKAHRKNEC